MAEDAYNRYLALSNAKQSLSDARRAYRAGAKLRKPVQVYVNDKATAYAPGRAIGGRGAYKYRKRRRYAYPRRRRVYGRGGFWGDLWGKIKSVGSALPRGTFSSVGNALLPGLGGQIGSSLSSLTGMGAYAPGDSSAAAGYIDQDVPQVTNSEGTDGAVVIQHKEYIRDIVSVGDAFHMAATLPINPGMSETFPWLSQIAQSFTQYQLRGCVFWFKTTSGALATTQSLGEVIMAVNYDSYQETFTNKQQMLNEIMSQSTVPSISSACGVETKPAQSTLDHLYLRSGEVDEHQDLRFYDLGRFQIATQGQATGTTPTLGELWVTYEVALFKPQLAGFGAGEGTPSYHCKNLNWDNNLTVGLPLSPAFDNIGIDWTDDGKDETTITFPDYTLGKFLCTLYWPNTGGPYSGAVCSAPSPQIPAGSTGTLLNIWTDGGFAGASYNGSQQAAVQQFVVEFNGNANCSVRLKGGGGTDLPTYSAPHPGDIFIVKLAHHIV